MLSYRHGFHAGNHGDVLKHAILIQVLNYLTQKETPLLYIDTHAAAGMTLLTRGAAEKSGEFARGVGKLYGKQWGVSLLDEYTRVIGALQSGGPSVLRHYPGSPAIANLLLRPSDGLRLFELHPRDYTSLLAWSNKQENNKNGRHIKVVRADGFTGPEALLPPPARRALILIDPSYELKTDYRAVRACVKESLRRLPGATIIVWIPLVARSEAQQLAAQLRRTSASWLYCHLLLDNAVVHKLFGSAVMVLNPPYTLEEALTPALPILANLMGNSQQKYQLEAHLV